MKHLLWKDLRLFGDVFLAGVALVLASYLIAFILVYSDPQGFAWSKVIGGGASLTRFTSILICALMGGYAFAREAEDGSALFLASLPANRGRVVASKVLVSFTLVAAFWCVSLAVLLVTMRAMGVEWMGLQMMLVAMTGYISSGLLVFGVAWLLSVFLQSAVGAAFAGLLALAPVYLTQVAARWYFPSDSPIFLGWTAVSFMAGAGTMGVLCGAWLYIRYGACAGESLSALLPAWAIGDADLSDRVDSRRPRAGTIRALVWKDYRVVRLSLALGLCIIVVPYGVAAGASALNGDPAVHMRGGALASIALSVVVFAFWSGAQMAHENATGANRFLASLPIPWLKAQWSRVGTPLVPAAVVGLTNVAILILAHNAASHELRFDAAFSWSMWNDAPFIVMGLALANGAALAFAASWFASAYYRRPALSIVLGILAGPVTVGLWAAGSGWCSESDRGLSPLAFSCTFTFLTAATIATMLAAGCTIDARRPAYD
ncbi:MAG: ABC transporter permease [Candidatus Hydrogenedentes bacterium]|nr:ABC transporter permease [Candidatus Hydrogenedentota bacterium]